MTLFCLMFAMGNGVPVWLVGVAMLCDTALFATAMLTGIIPHH